MRNASSVASGAWSHKASQPSCSDSRRCSQNEAVELQDSPDGLRPRVILHVGRTRLVTCVEQPLAWLKRVLSYRRTTWTIADYPVHLRRQDVGGIESSGRGKPIAWTAQVINWWQKAGHGDTKEEALTNLRNAFENFRNTHDRLPRPGTGAPVEFAPSHLIERHEALARDFLYRVLDLNYDECFLSDQSSLWDFHDGDSNEALHRKISDVYQIDVSDVEGARLGDIFEKISAHQRAG